MINHMQESQMLEAKRILEAQLDDKIKRAREVEHSLMAIASLKEYITAALVDSGHPETAKFIAKEIERRLSEAMKL